MTSCISPISKYWKYDSFRLGFPCFIESKISSLPWRATTYIRMFPKIGVPRNGWFIMENIWKTLLKWMIWGYPYFWKHPYNTHDSYPNFTRTSGRQSDLSFFFQPRIPWHLKAGVCKPPKRIWKEGVGLLGPSLKDAILCIPGCSYSYIGPSGRLT